jgi:hypothetical protein
MPERALRELPIAEQESVVAHEMAHVLRRDPAWLLTGRVLGALFFFHPLVLLAGNRLRRVAELRCDDWAVAATGRPLALARCLTRVAGWGGEVMPATAMAGDPRWLAGRVARLLEWDRQSSSAPPSGWLRPTAAVALVAMALWIPGISLAGDTAASPAALATAPEPVVEPLPPAAAAAPASPAPAVGVLPSPVASPAPVPPLPVTAPLPPARPAFAIPPPGPLPPAELATLDAALALEVAELEAILSDVDRQAIAALAEAHRMAERAPELSEARREEIERELRRAGNLEREELRRLAEEMASERDRLADEMTEHRQLLVEELAGQRRAMAEEARRMAEEARALAADMAVDRQHHRERARRMAEERERVSTEMRLEMERLRPELEKLRQELYLRTEERERLRREVESLRRELEARDDTR